MLSLSSLILGSSHSAWLLLRLILRCPCSPCDLFNEFKVSAQEWDPCTKGWALKLLGTTMSKHRSSSSLLALGFHSQNWHICSKFAGDKKLGKLFI